MPPPAKPSDPTVPSAPAAKPGFRATLRIDAEPGPRRFQGVWLEQGENKLLVDYRKRELWTAFDGLAVDVTGHCYEPFGERITNQTHFAIETLAVADRKTSRRFHGFGPEQTLTGSFVTETGAPGTKLEGSTLAYFESEGKRRQLAGGESGQGAATIVARIVEINLAYMATTGGEQLWVVARNPAGWVQDPATAPKRIPCP
jgi:hypothetical protein